MTGNMWDQRYGSDSYFYGTEPNAFLKTEAQRLGTPPKDVLSLAEGEGRNGVFLASLGHKVTGVDSSVMAMEKARRLARERGVSLDWVQTDLADFLPAPESYDAVVSIFCHLPAPLRRQVHRRAAEALRPGGVLLLEAYTPAQLRFGTGGPKDASLLYSAEALREDFSTLELLRAEELEREVVEGQGHTGRAAVVQVVARRP